MKKLLGTTAKMTFHLVVARLDPSALRGGPLPTGVIVAPAAEGDANYPIQSEPMLQGDRLVDAALTFDERTAQPVVSFRLDSVGAKKFADITRVHVGEPFAILLDGKVLSAPVIREPITGGSGQISGDFTPAEASSLAALLRAGALPVPLTVIEERTVGPDLGGDAIRMGAITGLAGFALVCAFMIVLYGRWGLVANMALAVNVVLTFAGLSLFGATLTLPGIAGIVLGIGLAVDANVLINERIKEEARGGRSAAAALDHGFKRAYHTILDSNVTTLIATLLLFWFGSGPVRGFAVTMGLGIVTSMFTAVAIVRAVMATWVHRRRPKQFLIQPLLRLNLLPAASSIRFMRARFLGIAVSMLLSIASVTLFITPGLNYGIDFAGGILMEVKTSEDPAVRQSRGDARQSRRPASRRGRPAGVRRCLHAARPDRTPARQRRRPAGRRRPRESRRRCGCAGIAYRAHRSGRTEGQRRARPDRRHRGDPRERRHAGLHLGPLRGAVRSRRHRDARVGRDEDGGVPRAHRPGLQPHCHCRGAHADRLLRERQGRGL